MAEVVCYLAPVAYLVTHKWFVPCPLLSSPPLPSAPLPSLPLPSPPLSSQMAAHQAGKPLPTNFPLRTDTPHPPSLFYPRIGM